jgi:hypothetical protein
LSLSSSSSLKHGCDAGEEQLSGNHENEMKRLEEVVDNNIGIWSPDGLVTCYTNPTPPAIRFLHLVVALLRN